MQLVLVQIVGGSEREEKNFCTGKEGAHEETMCINREMMHIWGNVHG